MSRVLQTSLARFSSIMRRRGIGGSLRAVGALIGHSVFVRERHVWYQLDLHGERPARLLPDGLAVGSAAPGDADLLLGLDSATPRGRGS